MIGAYVYFNRSFGIIANWKYFCRTINNTTMLQPLIGLTLDQITEQITKLNLRRFVGAQITDWLYKKRATTFDDMLNLSKQNRELLGSNFSIGRETPVAKATSNDGTQKYLFATEQNNHIESVYIPSETSRTLCISSQAGCRMGCRFCMTGRLGFLQNLTAAQIINQVLSVDQSEELTNIVFMGMGEPLDNTDNVLRAVEILTTPWGLAWSPTRITVSTIGVIDNLRRLLDESKVHIAVSLHNPFPEERIKLMPAENKNPIRQTIELLTTYDFTHQRRVSFEYIMFEGVNDSDRHIAELVKMLRPISGCRVNLIRFHQIPDSDLKGSSPARIKEFNTALNKAGITTTTRSSRGEDIMAACGMLAASGATPPVQ